MRTTTLFLSLSTLVTTQALLVPTPVKPSAYATLLPRIFPRDNELASNGTLSGPCCEEAGGCCPHMTVCVFEGCCRVGETCPPGTILSASPTSSKDTSSSTNVGFPTDTSTPTTSSGSSTNQGAIIAGGVIGGVVFLSAITTTYRQYRLRRALRFQREANEIMLRTSSSAQQIQPHFMPPPPMQPPQMASIANVPETPMYPPPWESTMPPSLDGQNVPWQRNDSTSNLTERPSMLPLNYHSPLPWS